MKTVVIYKTTSGFTKRYAEWISEELKADIFPHSQMTLDRMLGYDTIIYGGSLHAAGVSGVDLIRKNLRDLSGKKLLVFTTGASPYSKKVEDEVRDRNFTPEEQKRLRFFYLRGGYDHSKLDLKNRLLMDLLRIRLLMKRKRTPEEVGMLAAFKHPLDAARKENLRYLMDYAKSLL
jgi:flavodoxin